MITKGSVWSSTDGRLIQVITEVVVEGKSWVHYRLMEEVNGEVKEFSCYTESFLSRFYKLPEK